MKEIETVTFYALLLVTVILQLTMYFERARFLKTLKGKSALRVKPLGLPILDLGIMIQIVFPVRLEKVESQPLIGLRAAATKYTTYWIISLSITLVLPILISKLLE